MNGPVTTLGAAVLIIVGVGLFPFAALALLLSFTGQTQALGLVVLDVILLALGATGVVGLWRKRQ
jgi:hypothetical protein